MPIKLEDNESENIRKWQVSYARGRINTNRRGIYIQDV